VGTDVLSARQAADLCGVSEKTVRTWIRQGKLPAQRSDRSFRILRADVADLAAAHAADSANGRNPGAGVRDLAADDERGPGAESADGVAMLEMVRLVGRLQEENRNLAGQVGYLQAQLQVAQDQVRALEAPSMSQDVPQRSPANAMLEPAQEPAPTRNRPWWRFWRG
jgi:excisionase family DNA binding protein